MLTTRLRGSYPLVVALVLLALLPNSLLTTAYTPMLPGIGHDLGASAAALQLVEGISNAGLAAGAMLAAYLAQKLVQRRLFLAYLTLFVVACVLAATAPGLGLFAVGRVLQGVANGLMIISALPVLVSRFPAGRLPLSVVFADLGLFGATTMGPLVAGPVVADGIWRLLFWACAVAGVLALGVTLLGYEAFDPPDPGRQLDRPAMTLGVLGTLATFVGTSSLTGHGFGSPVFLVPFVAGVAGLVVLVVVEYRKEDPLVPVRALSTQLPVTGTIVAMVGGAVFVAVLGLAQLLLTSVARTGPEQGAVLFWPMPVGLVVAAVVFGLVMRTRWLPVLVNVGLLSLGAAAVLLALADPADPGALLLPAAAALGFGAGATVSPGLFLAGMGVPSDTLGRAFALVLLLRAAAAYAVAPIVLYAVQGPDLGGRVQVGFVAMAVLAGVGLVASLAVPAVSGARLRTPDLHAWIEEGGMALPSPTTAVHARPGQHDEDAEPLLPRPRRGRD